MNDAFATLLAKHDLRVTQPRKLVFDILQHSDRPLSLLEIIERCPSINRSSIYRTIETCLKIRAVRVVTLGWKKQYELTDLFNPHHHHFRCTNCNQLTHIADTQLESAIASISEKYHFTPTNHHFEIEGLCRRCRAQ